MLRKKKYVVYDDHDRVVIITHNKRIAIKYAKEKEDAS
ncbi:hypothetical protein CRP345_gp08 [Roseobacter phage CRP-345]|nr:hypothetical protein CRP345_gp08 [Roseobacter phage CRP-345]